MAIINHNPSNAGGKAIVDGTYKVKIIGFQDKSQFNKFNIEWQLVDKGYEYGGKFKSFYNLAYEGGVNALAAVIRAVTGDWVSGQIDTDVLEVGMPFELELKRVETENDKVYYNIKKTTYLGDYDAEEDDEDVESEEDLGDYGI